MSHAAGEFEVKLVPLAGADNGIGRMSIDKEFRGDLAGTSKGEMLSHVTAVMGSAGYVAMERVTGSLEGRTGTFVLQHSATMTLGVPRQSVSVVPDSGSEQFQGLRGTMTITIADGRHSYDFEYYWDGA